ncbi:type IV conjugative transfer system lipoprotein TraV [Vibrio mimicus]|uniref:type IV conjugative transfer system lipoprotein TraV n=1 Tax=Vibrio mimicus TaxID=674 RepID=UPI002F959497
MKTMITLVSAILLLSGCAAGLDEDYACTQVGGVPGCTTMNEVRSNIDLYAAGQSNAPASPPTLLPPIHRNFMTLPRRDRHGAPARTADVVRKVTVFPFVDKSGHYVDTTDIYLILDDSHWTGRPVRAIWED